MSCANCANMYQKSSVNAYTQAGQTVVTGSPVTFVNGTRTGCSINFTAGTTSIRLAKPGLYQVQFSAYGAESGTAGNITVQMYRNGVAVPGAVSSANSTTVTDVKAIGFSSVVRVLPSCAAIDNDVTLTFVNTGVGATFGNVQATVIKMA